MSHVCKLFMLRAFVLGAIQCSRKSDCNCQVAGNSRKTGDVIHVNIRFLLSEALLFNGSTFPKSLLISKEISSFSWNYLNYRKPKEGTNCNSCGVIVFRTVDRS